MHSPVVQLSLLQFLILLVYNLMLLFNGFDVVLQFLILLVDNITLMLLVDGLMLS